MRRLIRGRWIGRFPAAVLLTLLAAGLLLAGGQSPVPAEGDRSRQEPNSENSAEGDNVGDELEAIRKEIAEIRATLERLEQAVTADKGASEFSPVMIRIETEAGEPLSGFDVKMYSLEGRHIEASDVSGADGVGLTRQLPYGDYRISISHPSGWRMNMKNQTVEPGKSFEKVVRAPDPSGRATVAIRSSIDRSRFEGLRFGERRHYRSGYSAYSVSHSPEPGQEDAGRYYMPFDSFPTVSDGIGEVAVQLEVSVEQEIEQPDGDAQTWYWRPPEELRFPRILLAIDDRVTGISDYDGGSAEAAETARYFRRQDEDDRESSSRRYKVGYLKINSEQKHPADEVALPIVPGTVTVAVESFLGKPDDAVLQSLEHEGPFEQPIWLRANLDGSSEWIPKVLNLDGWERGTSISFHARQVSEVADGETVEIAVESP